MSSTKHQTETYEEYLSKTFDKHCDSKGLCNSNQAYAFMNDYYKDWHQKVYGEKEEETDLPMDMFAREWGRTELDSIGSMTKEAMLEKARKD
jgi:hypothetical protein